MKVVFKNTATNDLEQIVDYIADYNPARAASLVQELRVRALKIGDFPQAYPVIGRFGARELRRCVHGNYLIFYRIARGRVEILQVVHGARNFDPNLF